MFRSTKRTKKATKSQQSTNTARGRSLSRRGFLYAGALLGLSTLVPAPRRALAWSSWTNATSGALKNLGMGDCVHEDLVQIAYARMLRNHANDTSTNSLLNPWAGVLASDKLSATVAGDTVWRSKDGSEEFVDDEDLAKRLFRENLAYLRIGSCWNDAAANTLFDFSYSCYYANSVPKFSGSDYYEGAWDVAQHIKETNAQGSFGMDALVQFTMNDRNNFIHGMLSSNASHTKCLKQSDIKQFALQWLGVAYEYARTGEVCATSDVTKEQAQKIFDGFIDTYDQLDTTDPKLQAMRISLKASDVEASTKLPRRRLRLRALGMMCHTMEDLWCPAHTCRTYFEGDNIRKNTILAFCNYKLQNGSMPAMLGYHIPFDRYATSDINNSTNWREALTRGEGSYKGTEMLENVIDNSMSCLDDAATYFNTLGMNETIACVTQLFEYLFGGTAWDDGVRNWVNTEVMPTYFNENGQSVVCDAGRRCLYTPTYVISPIKAMSSAYSNAGLGNNLDEAIELAKSYDAWQRGAHKFFSGNLNTQASKYISSGFEGDSVWSDSEGESRLVALVNKLHDGYSSLSSSMRKDLLNQVGCNRCHSMVSALKMISGMLQDFSIDLTGGMRPASDATMSKLAEVRAFFVSGTIQQAQVTQEAVEAEAALIAEANDAGEDVPYVTSNMAIQDLVGLDDGSYLMGVRDLDSLETSVMLVAPNTPGIEQLEEGISNLTITYALNTEFEDDPDYCYDVTSIDYANMSEDVYMATGWVTSVSDDAKSLVLNLNDLSEYPLLVREGVAVPKVGDYICAYYAHGNTSLELIGYAVLDDPGELIEVTYPVEMVAGSSVWLLTNQSESGDGSQDLGDGYRDYLRIEYDSADMFEMPVEGQEVTVRYHDEAYGQVTDVDEHALATSSEVGDVEIEAAQDEEDEFDSVGTPGYLELGNEYGKLTYGNEVFHVANVFGQPDDYPTYSSTSTEEQTEPVTEAEQTPASPEEPPTQNTSSSSTPTAAAKATTGAQTTRAAAPNTGDPLFGANGVLAGAAVAGAGMVAYSTLRRTEEQQSTEED